MLVPRLSILRLMEAEAGPEIDLEEEVEAEEDGVLVEEVERDALVVVIEAQVPEEAFREAFLGALPTDEVAAVVRNAAKHWRQTLIVFEVEA
jgi:hypothetical protein